MASDMDPSTATFGTADLLLASGDDIAGATGCGWGSLVAQNTGWLYYQPRHLASETATITAGDDCVISLAHAYLPAGTYSIYGYVDADGAPEGTGYLKWDGTALVTWIDETATTGSLCGWATETGGWFAMQLTGSANASDIVVVTAFSYRFGSYAP